MERVRLVIKLEFDEMKIMKFLSKFYLPYFCFFMWGKAALVTMKDPFRWTL